MLAALRRRLHAAPSSDRSLKVVLLVAVGSALASAGIAAPFGGAGPLRTSGALAAVHPSPSADWPMFGVTPERGNVSPAGIAEGAVGHLVRRVISLPGIVDSSPIFLRGVRVGPRRHDVILVTTMYGRTLALDAGSGRELWQFVPSGIAGWEGSRQFTNATPAADPSRKAVYAVSPDGKVHKLDLATGREVRGDAWPASVTKLPAREKVAPALNVVGGYVLVTTGGYGGDADPYQGHVVAISRTTGRLHAVFNSLCSERRSLQVPSTCRMAGGALASDSAIWGRGGAVVDRRAHEVYVSTGNGPFDGRRLWGDSLLVLSFPDLKLKRNWTPSDQSALNSEDLDVGSASPALLPGGLVLQGGKAGRMDVLSRARPNGRDPRPGPRLGGQLQTLPLPGDAPVLVSAPAVWRDCVFVGTTGGTAGYRVERRRLRKVWENTANGTSPVVAGGLLYVYDQLAGRLNVYRPRTGQPVASLPAAPGHWNSPIVADGRIWLPEGNANHPALTGTLSVYTPG